MGWECVKQLAHFSNVTWSLLILAFKDAEGETQTALILHAGNTAHSARTQTQALWLFNSGFQWLISSVVLLIPIISWFYYAVGHLTYNLLHKTLLRLYSHQETMLFHPTSHLTRNVQSLTDWHFSLSECCVSLHFKAELVVCISGVLCSLYSDFGIV